MCIYLQINIRKPLSEIEVAQSCLTLCDPMDCSLSGSSVYGIFQARVLEWIAISFSRESSRSRNRTPVSHIAGRRFTIWATREALASSSRNHFSLPISLLWASGFTALILETPVLGFWLFRIHDLPHSSLNGILASLNTKWTSKMQSPLSFMF